MGNGRKWGGNGPADFLPRPAGQLPGAFTAPEGMRPARDGGFRSGWFR